METFTSEMQAQLTPKGALDLLKDGNQRFVEGKMTQRDLLKQARDTEGGQYPFGVVLSCIDSRVSSELIFDLGIGDIFSIRVAGNVINEDVLGSMEFACKVAKSKVILVLGHSHCGAVKGACDGVEMGNLSALLSKISPSVQCETSEAGDRSSANGEFVKKVTKINVEKSINQILERSAVIKDLVSSGDCVVVGGVHDIGSGKVHFFH